VGDGTGAGPRTGAARRPRPGAGVRAAGRRVRRLRVAALVAAVPAAVAALAVVLERPDGGGRPLDTTDLWTREVDAFYAPSSPWNTPLPADVPVHPRSAPMVDALVRAVRARGFVIAVTEWTVPLVRADPAARHDIALTASWAPRRVLPAVPVPDDARPDPEGDGHLAVIDPVRGCEWDLWQARRGPGGRWEASWGNVTPLHGAGVYPDGLSARGSGFALAAGLIRPEELAAGRIDHALVFAFPGTEPGHVPPATKSDGRRAAGTGMPMGTRLQLDPALDLDALGLTGHERVVAEALQRHGMVLGDTGGVPSLYAAHPSGYGADDYGALLPRGARVALGRLPVERMRVVTPPPPPPQPVAAACGSAP